jgi:hypothetical protein
VLGAVLGQRDGNLVDAALDGARDLAASVGVPAAEPRSKARSVG